MTTSLVRRTPLAFLASAIVLVAGCRSATDASSDRQPGNGPITHVEYPSSVSVEAVTRPGETSADSVFLSVRFRNTGSATATVQHGACSTAIWLYRRGAESGPPAWDSERVEGFCILPLYVAELAPGDTYDLSAPPVSRARLRAEVPAGSYEVFVVINRWGDSSPSKPRFIVLPAGEITVGLTN